ncbi:MAG: YeeE/YedE family protein [Arenimonas sp.]
MISTLTQFTPLSALTGGGLIGLSASLLIYFNGRIAGISGIAWGALHQKGFERIWRIVFIAYVIIGGSIWIGFFSNEVSPRFMFPVWKIVLAGLLVGIGTKLESGCTSGHGICGIARLSKRSMIAVIIFMLSGIITTSLVRHVF